jgi:hypothetical protein
MLKTNSTNRSSLITTNWGTFDLLNSIISVSISGGTPESGSSFEQGSHRIIYYATDSHGNMAMCDVAFQVSGKISL